MLDKHSLIKAERIQGQISHDEGHILSWRESWGRETMSVKRGGIFSSGKNGKKEECLWSNPTETTHRIRASPVLQILQTHRETLLYNTSFIIVSKCYLKCEYY